MKPKTGFFLAQQLVVIAVLAILFPPLLMVLSKLTQQWRQLPKTIYSQNELRYLEVFLRRDLDGATSIFQPMTALLLNGDQVSYQLDNGTLKRQLTRITNGKVTITTTTIAKAISISSFDPILLQKNLLQLTIHLKSQTVIYKLFLPNAK